MQSKSGYTIDYSANSMHKNQNKQIKLQSKFRIKNKMFEPRNTQKGLTSV